MSPQILASSTMRVSMALSRQASGSCFSRSTSLPSSAALPSTSSADSTLNSTWLIDSRSSMSSTLGTESSISP
jgi:hypothetical protein